jgi:hypothetical protein
MWQESDNAVGDLLRSTVPGPVDRMNQPPTLSIPDALRNCGALSWAED